MGTANSLHASAYYGEYNERFGFKIILANRKQPFWMIVLHSQKQF